MTIYNTAPTELHVSLKWAMENKFHCKWVRSWTGTKINILNKKKLFSALNKSQIMELLKENAIIYIYIF